MKQALRFLKLDYITVKPYLMGRTLLIFLLIPVFFMLFTDGGAAVLFFLLGIGAMFVSYPFSVGEQNGIDALYATLSIKRENAVFGRYLFALCADLIVGLVAAVFTALTSFLKKTPVDWAEYSVVFGVALAFFTFVQAIQLPLFFRFGYAKAKLLSVLPFLLVPVVTLSFNFFQERLNEFFASAGAWITRNPEIAAVLIAGTWFAAMYISYRASCAAYRKREF
ncbi:MAG TPA: ABC-2 transporter permease [Clostridia bacterium]|nr:ABC-2 transporter permease [Clostridia bacterium]